MRLFVAAYPPPEAVSDLSAAVGRLEIGQRAGAGVNVRLATPEKWHITLAFLGDVAEERLPDVDAALRVATAPPAAPVPVRIAGGGRFGRGRFTIVWAGVQGDLVPLAKAVRRQLKRSRIGYDPKPLKPHLTLARPGDRMPAEAVAADIAALNGYAGPQWSVEAIELVRSHQGPRPHYDHLATYPVG
ncbi:RNA 2',3'-cyclic phosphodiesterase [Rhizomonospora bruguierae]|uniref:RNA 2',3'-cyclic phosphodiesterase n=1 Tax=Rhizomonospora bruguierae TaxID=1581705 RepID=UPI001BCCE4AA|nr:RNA 2',3'-cyclic phosphodiesterase [Micromonospora sp. NBRC 107566]